MQVCRYARLIGYDGGMKESTRCLIDMLHWLDRRQEAKRSRREISLKHRSRAEQFGRDRFRKLLIEYRQTL
jgi:hypothetical protein